MEDMHEEDTQAAHEGAATLPTAAPVAASAVDAAPAAALQARADEARQAWGARRAPSRGQRGKP